jgi:hypothetical protein
MKHFIPVSKLKILVSVERLRLFNRISTITAMKHQNHVALSK